jgi:hypothetical protein
MRVLTFPGTGGVENVLIEALFAGNDPILDCLREQFEAARLVDRDLTGSGFFLKFEIPAHVRPTDPKDLVVDDVLFDLDGLEHGGCAIAHVRGGYLDLVEAYLNAGAWPKTPHLIRVYYDTGEPRDLELLGKVWRKQSEYRAP